MTSSANLTFTGFDFSFAFLAALMKADLGDLKKKIKTRIEKQKFLQINLNMKMNFSEQKKKKHLN